VRQGHQVSIYACNKAATEYLDVPLDRRVVEQGVEMHYFPALAWSGKYMFCPALWRALEETVGQFDLAHIWSVYGFFNTAAAYWCRRRQVPHMLFPHGSLDPYLRRRNRPRKWFYTKAFAERDYRGASAVLFNTSEEMRLASDWLGLQPRPGAQGAVPRRVVGARGVAGSGNRTALPGKPSASVFPRSSGGGWWSISGGSTLRRDSTFWHPHLPGSRANTPMCTSFSPGRATKITCAR
jgi:hypothetical protein